MRFSNKNKYEFLENKIISQKNRFRLLNSDINELKKDFVKANILITGAAGSIGSKFCEDLVKFNFNSIYLIDKNENQLTELNRELILICNKKKIKKIRFICSDLTTFNIDSFIKINKITHYLNFAAVKHVRSEEELDSIKYMFLTNSVNFLPSKSYKLKKIFSVSTDKIVNPTSILGITKYLMETNLKNFKIKNKIFVSSARFGNVSFSNGSILKYVVDRTIDKKPFGVPNKLRRFFITHKEASSLCFKSLLKRNNGYVLLPDYKILKQDYLITEIVSKILKLFNYKGVFVSRIFKNNIISGKNYKILLTSPKNHGQKFFEEFYSKEEKLHLDIKDKSVYKVILPTFFKTNVLVKKIKKFNNTNQLKKYLCKQFKNYKPPKNISKVSKIL
tara:strand:- start:3777 stop:4946 length:1170 start_codon:yes stop_codon:yes gene_type:complete